MGRRALDEQYVNEVIEMVNNGMTNKDIGTAMGVNPANIQYIRSTHKDQITFSRYKGGLVSKTIKLPPVKEERNVYETKGTLMLAEKTVLLGGMGTALWYKIAGDKIEIMSKNRDSTITIDKKDLHKLIEELMRLSMVLPKFTVDNLEAY